MKTIRFAFAVLFSLVVGVLQAQEHGPIVGASFGTFHEKMDVASSMLQGSEFHYHVGYSYRQYFKHKIALDVTALYGTQGTEYQWYLAGSESHDVKGQYVSLGAVVSYECFKNFRVGIGADFAYYLGKIKSPAIDNTMKHPLDVPLIARVSYSVKCVEFQLAYKLGTCNLMKSQSFGRLTSRDLQLSVLVPLFK